MSSFVSCGRRGAYEARTRTGCRRAPALSSARADMPFNVDFDYGELIPPWPQNKERHEWPDSPVKDFLKDLRGPDMKGSAASPSVFVSILALTPKWGLSQAFKSSVTCAAVRVFQS